MDWSSPALLVRTRAIDVLDFLSVFQLHKSNHTFTQTNRILLLSFRNNTTCKLDGAPMGRTGQIIRPRVWIRI